MPPLRRRRQYRLAPGLTVTPNVCAVTCRYPLAAQARIARGETDPPDEQLVCEIVAAGDPIPGAGDRLLLDYVDGVEDAYARAGSRPYRAEPWEVRQHDIDYTFGVDAHGSDIVSMLSPPGCPMRVAVSVIDAPGWRPRKKVIAYLPSRDSDEAIARYHEQGVL